MVVVTFRTGTLGDTVDETATEDLPLGYLGDRQNDKACRTI